MNLEVRLSGVAYHIFIALQEWDSLLFEEGFNKCIFMPWRISWSLIANKGRGCKVFQWVIGLRQSWSGPVTIALMYA
jgi:hypothetical protein